MLNLMMMRMMMNEIDELIWQYNKERAIESLYDDEMVCGGIVVHLTRENATESAPGTLNRIL